MTLKSLTLHTLVLLFLLFSSCASSYFEGTITYGIETTYHEDNERYRKYYEEEKFGDRMVLYTRANGAVRRTYPNSTFGNKAVYYDPATVRTYATYTFMDTILTSSATARVMAEISMRDCSGDVINEIMDQPVACLEVIGRDTFGNYDVHTRYYYPLQDLKINTKAYKDYREFLLGEAYARSGAHWLRMELDYGNYTTTLQAIDITRRKILAPEVEVPQGFPIKNVD